MSAASSTFSDSGTTPASGAIAIAGALLGLTCYILIFGPALLDPRNIGWLMHRDPATHFLGWNFFRNEVWHLPLGRLERYGMEASSSIVYSDSIPLMALAFKPFADWLSHPFQYTGLWIVTSYMLQGLLAALLIARLTRHPLLILLATGFFLLSPIMLFRGGGHFALMGHWLILAAFLLYLSRSTQWRILGWALLLGLAALVHAYLAVMVLAVYAADLVKLWLVERALGVREVLRSGLLVAGAMALVMWLAGYFTTGGFATGGNGYYSMNLMAPFRPTPGGPTAFLSAHPHATGGQYEGFNYLGLGVLLLLLIGLPRWRVYPSWSTLRTLVPLFGVCLLLALYALSPRITWGSQTLLQTPSIPVLTEVFRASGRLFWPASYAIVLIAIFLTVRARRVWIAAALLSITLTIQIVDLIPLIRERITDRVVDKIYSSPLASPFWAEAAKVYRRVVVIPPVFTLEDFIPLSLYASNHDMAINIAYYGRPPSKQAEHHRMERIQTFLAGEIDPETLYVLRDPAWLTYVEPVLTDTTGIGIVDDQFVVAPAGLSLGLNIHAPALRPPSVLSSSAQLHTGQDIRFDTADSRRYAVAGWSWPETWGTWTDGPFAIIRARLTDEITGPLHATFQAHAFSAPDLPDMRVRVYVNGHSIARWQFEQGQATQPLTLVIPGDWVRERQGELVISLAIQHPDSPAAQQINTDPRLLGLGLSTLRIDY